MVGVSPIRVLIIDSHEMVRVSLALCLDIMEGIECVGAAHDEEAGLVLCAQFEPDVVITELQLRKMDGVTFTRTILKMHPRIKVIALDTSQRDDEIRAILEAGARKYLFKEIGIDELEQAIREVVYPAFS